MNPFDRIVAWLSRDTIRALADATRRSGELEAALAASRASQAAADDKAAKLEGALSRMEAEARKQRDDLERNHGLALAALKAQKDALAGRAASAEKETTEEKAERLKFAAQILKLKQQLGEASEFEAQVREETTYLRTFSERLRHRNEGMATLLDATEAERAKFDTDNKRLSQSLSIKESELRRIQKSHEALESEMTRLKAQLSQARAENDDVHRQLVDSRNDLKGAVDETRDLIRKLDALRTDAAREYARAEEVRSKLREAETRLGKASEELEAERRKRKDIEEQWRAAADTGAATQAALSRRIELVEAEKRERIRELADIRLRLDAVQRERGSLEQEISAAHAERDAAFRIKEQAERDVGGLAREREAALAVFEERRQSLAAEVERIRGESEIAQSALRSEFETAIAQIKSDLSRATSEADAARVELPDLRERLAVRERNIDRLQEAVKAYKVPAIAFNALPKSGAAYISRLIVGSLGMTELTITEARFLSGNIEASKISRLSSGGQISLDCFSPTPANLQNLDQYLGRMVLNIRDPRQACLSWTHHLTEASMLGRELVLPVRPPNGFSREPFQRRVEWVIDNHLPLHAEWLKAWFKIADAKGGRVKILVTRYEKFIEDERSYIEEILEFYGIPSSRFSWIRSGIPTLAHHREKPGDRWEEVFSPAQKQRASRILTKKLLERMNRI